MPTLLFHANHPLFFVCIYCSHSLIRLYPLTFWRSAPHILLVFILDLRSIWSAFYKHHMFISAFFRILTLDLSSHCLVVFEFLDSHFTYLKLAFFIGKPATFFKMIA